MTSPAANDLTLTDFVTTLQRSGFEGECHRDRAHCLVMSTDNSVYQVEPQAVIYPANAADLDRLMQLANQPEFLGLQFAPRCGGTGTNGQSLKIGRAHV